MKITKEDNLEDYLEEEESIMEEQDEGVLVDPAIFQKTISNLKMPIPQIIDINASVGDVLNIMQQNKIGSVIITSDNRLAGIVTERDILLKVAGIITDLDNTSVVEIMTPDPTTLRLEDQIAYVMHNMHVGGYRHVPIVNKDDEPISIVSIKDVLSFILDQFPSEVTNMAGEPYRGPVSREGA